MAYLNKEQYFKRAESAARRQAENGEHLQSQGVSEEVAELLQDLCRERHRLHSNIDAIVKGNTFQWDDDPLYVIAQINGKLHAASFAYMESLPQDYFEIDDMHVLSQYEEIDSDDEGYQDWYNENYARIYDEVDEVNNQVEKYLREIDEKYGTNFAPTGAQRIF